MWLARWFALGLSVTACSGLYTRPDGGVGGGGGGGGGTGGGTPGCTTAQQCPQPANSSAVCTQGACSFVCAAPLFHCRDSCCRATAISAGEAHTCILTSEGTVKCWGAITAGDGSFDGRTTPTDVVGLSSKVLQVSAGLVQTCARLDTGKAECWGLSTIGTGTSAPASTATPIDFGAGVTSLASGGNHVCLVGDGGVFCWGKDNVGQQGTNGGGERLSPGSVAGLAYNVRQVSAGMGHSCALLDDAGARCWGRNSAGECGDGRGLQALAPVTVVADDAGFVDLQVGFSFTCGRSAGGAVRCWGVNGEGQCGSGVVSGRSLLANDVLGVTAGLTQLALGPIASHACIVQDGGVLCWGSDDHGQLGDGNLGHQNQPVQALGITVPITAVAVGGRHTCAITSEGGVLCWGDDTGGQLGDGTKSGNHLTPVQVR